MTSLRSKIIGAGTWVFGGQVLSQVLRLGSNLILTRLLVPEMFGVMSIAMIFIAGASMLSDVGTRQYIIRAEGTIDQNLLNTVWVVQILRGAMICIVVILISIGLYLMGRFDFFASDTAYAHEDLPFVVAALSLLPVITGLQSTKLSVLNRGLRLGYLVSLETASQVLAIIIMILIAWYEQTIWALVIGSLIGAVFKTAGSHVFLPGIKNRFLWDNAEFEKVFNFGKWIFLSSIAGFFVNHADRLWLGGLISPEKLGIFTIASLLAYAAKTQVRKLSAMVILPALSKVSRSNPLQLSNAYYKARLVLDSFLMFLAGFLFQAGPALIDLLYDERYAEAGAMLRILSISLVSFSFLQGDKCLVALGQVRVGAAITATNAIVLNIAIPVSFLLFGFQGALLAIVLSPFVSIIYLFHELKKQSLLNLGYELRVIPLIFLGGIAGLGFSELTGLLSNYG